MSYFLDFQHLITTRPHDIEQVLISDLHLSSDEPALAQAFSSLLQDLIALPALKALYILGDWFDAWIGDDVYLSLSEQQKQGYWMTPFLDQLKQLSTQGCAIYVMHGNRDFLIGQPFCSSFGGTLIHEPYSLTIGTYLYRLEHGDALCTDDKAYQRFRKIMRNRLVQWYLLNKSLKKRLVIAEKLRRKSQSSNTKKATYIMNVNEQAVADAVSDYDALLHGHTHRPAVHVIDNLPFNQTLTQVSSIDHSKLVNTQKPCPSTKIRYVLGDWRILNKEHKSSLKDSKSNFDASFDSSYSTHTAPQVEAVIGVVVANHTYDQAENKKLSHSNESAELLMVKFTI